AHESATSRLSPVAQCGDAGHNMHSRLAGVALQLAALATFVAMDTIIKLLTAGFPVPQVMWARFLFGFFTVAIALRIVGGQVPWRSRAPGLQTLRSLTLAA